MTTNDFYVRDVGENVNPHLFDTQLKLTNKRKTQNETKTHDEQMIFDCN